MSTVATVFRELTDGGSGQVELVVVEGNDQGRALVLKEGRVHHVGTAAECDLVLTDERVSGRHLTVRVEAGRFHIEDTGSTNGTHYQGSRIDRAIVPAGATLKLGRTLLRIQPLAEALDIPPSRTHRFGDLVGASFSMRQVFAVLEHAAASDVTVLVEGETGTGKELAARALHEASNRRKGPFVAVDCGALPESLVDSELFGHVRGAFTGANADRKGAFVRARGGTVFLDELDGIPPEVQARLLRVLEERVVRPVGSDREESLDVRLVAATQSPLTGRVADGTFRADLFYRIAVLHLRLPPLRERREDLSLIVRELLLRRGFDVEALEPASMQRLAAHDWPGNVRELRNVIDRAVALSPGATSFEELRLWHRPRPSESEGLRVRTDVSFSEAKAAVVDELERRYLSAIWAESDGNISAAARRAELDRKHLRNLLRKHGLLDA